MPGGDDWDVASYERGRTDYPGAAIDLLVTRMGLQKRARVLDLGAGNGRLTRPLIDRFDHVIAVEPHAGMRAALDAAAPRADVLTGAAETIPLPAGSVDAVFAGSAFHWFDADRALPEIARVLRPRGALGLVWSRWARDTSDWAIEIDRVLSRHGTNPAAGWRRPFATTKLFAPLEDALLDDDQDRDREGVLAMVASISFIGALPEGDRRSVLDEVERILERHQLGTRGPVPMTNRIELAWTRKR